MIKPKTIEEINDRYLLHKQISTLAPQDNPEKSADSVPSEPTSKIQPASDYVFIRGEGETPAADNATNASAVKESEPPETAQPETTSAPTKDAEPEKKPEGDKADKKAEKAAKKETKLAEKENKPKSPKLKALYVLIPGIILTVLLLAIYFVNKGVTLPFMENEIKYKIVELPVVGPIALFLIRSFPLVLALFSALILVGLLMLIIL